MYNFEGAGDLKIVVDDSNDASTYFRVEGKIEKDIEKSKKTIKCVDSICKSEKFFVSFEGDIEKGDYTLITCVKCGRKQIIE